MWLCKSKGFHNSFLRVYMYYNQHHGHSKTFDQPFIFRWRCVLLSRWVSHPTFRQIFYLNIKGVAYMLLIYGFHGSSLISYDIISCHMMWCVTWELSGESNSYHPRPQAEGDMCCSCLTNLMSRNPRVKQRFCHMVSLLIKMSFLNESLIVISFYMNAFGSVSTSVAQRVKALVM